MLDALFLRLLAWLRNALPGHTTASRLMRQSGHWRNLPPHQRAAAYAQHMQTLRQLRQFHIEQKILPKLIDLLYRGLIAHLQAPLGQLFLICILAYLFNLFF
jgi:hypothetical protein